MKMLVAIPSYNRPYNIEKRTGYWIKEIKNADVKVFVCPSQYLYYSQVIPQDMLIKGAEQVNRINRPIYQHTKYVLCSHSPQTFLRRCPLPVQYTV